MAGRQTKRKRRIKHQSSVKHKRHDDIVSEMFKDPGILGSLTPDKEGIVLVLKEPELIRKRGDRHSCDLLIIYKKNKNYKIFAIELKVGDKQISRGMDQLRIVREHLKTDWKTWLNRQNTDFLQNSYFKLYTLLLQEQSFVPIDKWKISSKCTNLGKYFHRG